MAGSRVITSKLFFYGAALTSAPTAESQLIVISSLATLSWSRVGNTATETSGSTTMAVWFDSARNAKAALISTYSESELEIIADVFERFAKLWDDERKKVQKNQ